MLALFRIGAIALLSISACLLHAQTVPVCSVETIVSVLDQGGNIAASLAPSAFRATFKGHTADVTKAEVNQRTPRIVLIRDVSGSMSNSKATSDIAMAAATGLITSLPASARIALLSFADNVLQRVDFSHTVTDVLKEVQTLPIGKRGRPEYRGQTALDDAIVEALSMLQTPLPGDTIYIITDGGENHSHVTARNVASRLTARQVRLFSLIIEHGLYPTEEEQAGKNMLVHLAEISGGAAASVPDDLSSKGRANVERALRYLYAQIFHFYRLELNLSSITKPERWSLEVVDDSGRKQKDLKLMYPHDLVPCQGQQTSNPIPSQ